MTDFQQAALVGGGIAAVVLAGQLGRRELTWHKIAFPLLSVLGFGYAYLGSAPTGRPELWLYAAAIVVGLAFAAVATATTDLVRDTRTGRLTTICGAGFVATWLTALAARLVFIWAVEHDAGFRSTVGTFMLQHQIHQAAIAPFFVLWALAMVVGRLVAVLLRARRLTTPVAVRTLVHA